MKKIVLLGDSIRLIGYGTKVPEMLGESYTVFQPKDNCRWAKYTERMLFDYNENIKDADVIHWNNGHWDICNLFGEGSFTPLNQYVEDMVRIAKKLLKITPNVIFATTTTVKEANKYNSNSVTEVYNSAVVTKLKELGIIINDLYSITKGKEDEYICDDNIHLTPAGIDACAKQVCKIIKSLV